MSAQIYNSSHQVEWIDRVKGIGIILVVLGHMFGLLGKGIYLFHMPLFFVLSGYLFSGKRDPLDFVGRKLVHLGVPYLAFLILFNIKPCLALLLQIAHGWDSVDWQFFKNHFLNQIYGGVKLTEAQVIFWFPPVLLATQIAYYWLQRISSRAVLCWLMMLSYGGGLLNEYYCSYIQFPMALNVVLGALPFFFFGTCLKLKWVPFKQTFVLAISFVVMLIAVYLYGAQWKYNMRVADYGLPVLSFLAALGGTLICFWCGKKIKNDSVVSLVLTTIGAASMTIMYLHEFIWYLLPKHLSLFLVPPLVITTCWVIHQALKICRSTSWLFLGMPAAPPLARD